MTHKGISYTITGNSKGEYEIKIGRKYYTGNIIDMNVAISFAKQIIDSGNF